MNNWLIAWLAILVITIVVEIATMGLTSIWFAGGALVAAIVCALHGPVWLQVVLFVVVTFLLFGFTRPVAKKYFNKARARTNAESLIDQKGVCISEIDNLRGIGQIRINGQEWSARSVEEGVVIPEGAILRVREIRGVKLIVELDESVADHVERTASEAMLDPKYFDNE